MENERGNSWKPIAIVAIVIALLLMCLLVALACGTAAYVAGASRANLQRHGFGYDPQVPWFWEPTAEPTPSPQPAPIDTPAPRPTQAPLRLRGGATITYVEPDSPADLAGLTRGDTITAVDGVAIGEDSDLADVIAAYGPGDAVAVQYRHWRTGDEDTVWVTLGEHPDDGTRPYLGITYATTPSLGGLGD